MHVNVAMGTLLFNTTHYVMIMYVSFMLYSFLDLILDDVLPGDSKAIGIIGAL